MPSQGDAIQAVKVSRARWIVLLLLLGYLAAAWYSGQQARESYAKGYEAGRLSTAEVDRMHQAKDHLSCDHNGRNCVDK